MQYLTRNQFNAELSRSGVVLNQEEILPPAQQQLLYAKVGEDVGFLKEINHVYVTAQFGEKIGMDGGRPVASRTDTTIQERSTRDLSVLDPQKYYAALTEYDFHTTYSRMDAFAHLGQVGVLMRQQASLAIGRSQMMVGWNGESVAEQTDLETYPLLQDVNIGWLSGVRLSQPTRIMGYDSAGKPTSDMYKIGEGGRYISLDALVFAAIAELMDAWYQNSDDLVVLLGRKIGTAHGVTLLNSGNLPSERNALATWFTNKTIAGLPSLMPPYMPDRAVVVTSLKNLSIYHQLGTLRRTVIDNPKRNRVEEYISENQAYVVEDLGKFVAVRSGSILLPDGKGGWE